MYRLNRSRKYRMIYVDDNGVDVGPIKDGHIPTQIIVGTMTGLKQHTLFTEDDGEKFLDVKMALHPYLDITPMPSLSQLSLSLKKEDGSYEPDVDDDRLVPPFDEGVVFLELVIKKLRMTAEQQALIDEEFQFRVDDKIVSLRVETSQVNTPDKMKALLFHLEENPVVTMLSMDDMNMNQIKSIMMTVLTNNIPINALSFRYRQNTLSDNQMLEVFDMVGQINTLTHFNVSTDMLWVEGRLIGQGRISYRMNDLSEFLEKTSLYYLSMYGCNIVLDGDVTRLSNLLINHPTLYKLDLSGKTRENVTDFMESFQYIIPASEMRSGRSRDNLNEIDLKFTRS